MNVDIERNFYEAGPRKERRQKGGKKSRYLLVIPKTLKIFWKMQSEIELLKSL